MTKQEVFDSINWETVMLVPRYAGGHTEVLDAIFREKAKIAASWLEDDYDGTVIYAYEFPDGTHALISDSFGSCSGCDAWEDSTDEEARAMIQSLVSSARLFPSRDELIAYCETGCRDPAEYHFRSATNLVESLRHEPA